jgi:hypothetical protein
MRMRRHEGESPAQSATTHSAEQLDGAFDPREPARAPLQVMRRRLEMRVSEQHLDGAQIGPGIPGLRYARWAELQAEWFRSR